MKAGTRVFFPPAYVMFTVSWTGRAWCLHEWDRVRKKRGGGIFKAQQEERRARKGVNTFRDGTEGVCVCVKHEACYSCFCSHCQGAATAVHRADGLVELQTGNAHCDCTHRHLHAGLRMYTHGRVASACSASLWCDVMGWESFWDKGGTAFKVGKLSLSASEKKTLGLFSHPPPIFFFFTLIDIPA